MAKTKERSETEHLRATVKKQRSIIKHLKKEITRYTKKAHQFELEEDDFDDVVEQTFNHDNCPECQKGKLIYTDLGIRKMIRCDNCNYRKTIKK